MKPRLIVPLLGAAALVASASAALATDCPHGGKRPSFESLDADQNGALTPDEFTAGAQARAADKFQKLDLNQDGVVTQDEVGTAKEQWREKRRERRKNTLPM